jgi:glycosyltransferase involved in cell wall biosynthesis
MTPRVSVVLAARNEEAAIGGAVESILAQTLGDWELIVVDDGSSDRTADIVAGYGDERITVLRRRPSGLPASLNAGLRAARGPLIARQDADDRSLPQRLERQVDFLDQRPDVIVLGSRWIEVDSKGRRRRPRARVVTGDLTQRLVGFNPITHATAIFRRDAVLALGGYDESLPYAADYDLWLRVAASGALVWNLDVELAVRMMSGGNMSALRERSQLLEELTIRWRDVRRRRAAGVSAAGQLAQIAARAPMLAVPLPARRLVRIAQRKTP